jgi:ABC-type transport system involved in multi-copper enzyme maturation permease subunit
MGKGRPFLEIFTYVFDEDYRLPILEVFAFLFALGTFVFVDFAGVYDRTGETFAYSLISTLCGFPLLFIFVVLILKNVAYGLGSDLDRGVMQTLFSYPLKRRYILTARLLSGLGIAVVLFLGIQIFGLFLLAPDIMATYSNTVFLTYAAHLCSPALLLAGLVLLLTLRLKRGGLALIIGVILFLAGLIFSGEVTYIAYATDSDVLLKIWAVINPNSALQAYYYHMGASGFLFREEVWVPSFSEALLYLVTGYLIVAAIFIVGYIYFDRKLEI